MVEAQDHPVQGEVEEERVGRQRKSEALEEVAEEHLRTLVAREAVKVVLRRLEEEEQGDLHLAAKEEELVRLLVGAEAEVEQSEG